MRAREAYLNANGEEEGRLNQLSVDSGVQPPSLLDQVIGLSPEELENISLSELETTLLDSLGPPSLHPPLPGVQVIFFWKIPLVKFA